MIRYIVTYSITYPHIISITCVRAGLNNSARASLSAAKCELQSNAKAEQRTDCLPWSSAEICDARSPTRQPHSG